MLSMSGKPVADVWKKVEKLEEVQHEQKSSGFVIFPCATTEAIGLCKVKCGWF